MQAAVRSGMFVASFHHTKKGCLLFVNLLCSPQAGLTTEQHPCQELRARRWGSWSLESIVLEGQVPRWSGASASTCVPPHSWFTVATAALFTPTHVSILVPIEAASYFATDFQRI